MALHLIHSKPLRRVAKPHFHLNCSQSQFGSKDKSGASIYSLLDRYPISLSDVVHDHMGTHFCFKFHRKGVYHIFKRIFEVIGHNSQINVNGH